MKIISNNINYVNIKDIDVFPLSLYIYYVSKGLINFNKNDEELLDSKSNTDS